MRIDADDQMLSQKLQAARDYSELSVDVNRIVEREGIDELRTEYLRPVSEDSHNGVSWDHHTMRFMAKNGSPLVIMHRSFAIANMFFLWQMRYDNTLRGQTTDC